MYFLQDLCNNLVYRLKSNSFGKKNWANSFIITLFLTTLHFFGWKPLADLKLLTLVWAVTMFRFMLVISWVLKKMWSFPHCFLPSFFDIILLPASLFMSQKLLSSSSQSDLSPPFKLPTNLPPSFCFSLPAPTLAPFASILSPPPYPTPPPPTPPSPKPQPLCGGQLRLFRLMRVDGVVWAVELTTFTGLNENDPSSLAGLSPHWPNFIMANYHGRPLLLCCCRCCRGPAPIYMDT